jgi:hypothetical protein
MSDATSIYGQLQLCNNNNQSLRAEISSLKARVRWYQIAVIVLLALSILGGWYMWNKNKNCVAPSAAAQQPAAPEKAVAVTILDARSNLYLSPDFNTLGLVLASGAFTWTMRYSSPSSVALLCADQARNVYFIDATNGNLTILLSTTIPANAYFTTDVSQLNEGQTSATTKLLSPSGDIALSVNAQSYSDVAYSAAPQCASGMINSSVQMLATTQTTWTVSTV